MLTRTERQKLGVSKWIKSGGRSTLVYATGVGKTNTALITIETLIKSNKDAFVLISVPTKYLKEQWLEEVIKRNLLNNCKVEVINTIVKNNWNCDLLVIDEIHRTPTDSLGVIFNKVTYKMILGLTATLERLDGKEEIIKKYAPVCDEISLEEARLNNWISPVKNYLVLLDVDLTEYGEANRKFNSYFAFFNWDYNCAMKCMQDWKYRNSYAKQMGVPPKDVMTMAANWMRTLKLRKDFIENHPKKLEVCRKIMEARKDKKGITFCPTIKFAESIGSGVTLHSGKKAKENDKIREEFNQATSGFIHSSKALNEGANISGLSVGIKMNVNSSKVTSVQTQGRICRFEPGKVAEMFTLVINNTQELKWFANSNTSDYIVLRESELDKVLNYEDVETRPVYFKQDLEFRF